MRHLRVSPTRARQVKRIERWKEVLKATRVAYHASDHGRIRSDNNPDPSNERILKRAVSRGIGYCTVKLRGSRETDNARAWACYHGFL